MAKWPPADHQRRVGNRDRAAAADAHQIFGAALERGIEHVVLLLDHAGIVAGDDEHALDARQRFLRAVRSVNSATATLASAPSTSRALSALRTTLIGLWPKA